MITRLLLGMLLIGMYSIAAGYLFLKKHLNKFLYLIYSLAVFLLSFIVLSDWFDSILLGLIGIVLLEMCLSDATSYTISIQSLAILGICIYLLFPNSNYVFALIVFFLGLLFYLVMPGKLGFGDILFISIISLRVSSNIFLMGIWVSCILALFYLLFFKMKKLPFIPFLTLGFGISLLI